MKKKRAWVVPTIALSAALCSGMGLGILYAYRNPLQVNIIGRCQILLPEFLAPSST